MKEKSDIRTKINYINVKEAFEKNLIPDLNNQTFFENDDGTCPYLLYAALDRHDLKLMRFLLEKGVDPNIVAPGRENFLFEILNDSRYCGNIKLITTLVNAGVDINRPNTGEKYKNFEPLVITIIKRNLVVAEFLIKSGADLDPPCREPEKCGGCNPLQAALRNEETFSIANLLLDRRADVNKCCKGWNSPFYLATKYKNTQLMKRFLDHGVNSNYIHENHFYNSPLHCAVEMNNFEAMKLILNYELTDVNTVHPYWSIVHHAMYYNSLNCIDGLLNANPDVNIVSAKHLLAVEVGCYHYHQSNLRARKKLKKHIVKLRAAGFYLNDQNVGAVSAKIYKSFYAKCLREIDLMKKNTISTMSRISFYDLLFKTNQQLALCLESLDDQELVHFGFHEKFPLYAGMIEYKLNKGYKLVKLREELHTAIFKLFNNHLPYPFERQIFNYFSINELIKLRLFRWKEEGKIF